MASYDLWPFEAIRCVEATRTSPGQLLVGNAWSKQTLVWKSCVAALLATSVGAPRAMTFGVDPAIASIKRAEE